MKLAKTVWLLLFCSSAAIAAVMNADALHDETHRMLPWTHDPASCSIWTWPALLIPSIIASPPWVSRYAPAAPPNLSSGGSHVGRVRFSALTGHS